MTESMKKHQHAVLPPIPSCDDHDDKQLNADGEEDHIYVNELETRQPLADFDTRNFFEPTALEPTAPEESLAPEQPPDYEVATRFLLPMDDNNTSSTNLSSLDDLLVKCSGTNDDDNSKSTDPYEISPLLNC